jgi:hypothetical protein
VGWKLPTLALALWVIALTVVGVALGVLLTGPEGALIGAIPLALGTVLAGYVPAIRDAADRRRKETAQREEAAATAQERWDAVGEPITGTPHPTADLPLYCARTVRSCSSLDARRSWTYCERGAHQRMHVQCGPLSAREVSARPGWP